ncbi:hypothetical protein CCZ37_15995 [Vibrio qinghaiensis]|uniref:Uncharacterized protein n=1 Tax=Vibrio qinghaiensis TaxID=2025808 RepID=A0A223N2L2_9VIBR|nr:hypothetical protein [Vibrio qinghaiensis]ASU24055.1 hypothetical protein CCZ37_15995 [Vibrio qinghaiensis]
MKYEEDKALNEFEQAHRWLWDKASSTKNHFDARGYDYDYLKRIYESALKMDFIDEKSADFVAFNVIENYAYEYGDYYGEKEDLMYQSFTNTTSFHNLFISMCKDLQIDLINPTETCKFSATLYFSGLGLNKVLQERKL